jgi:hypothetical protein
MAPFATALRLVLLLIVGVGCLTLSRPPSPDAGGCGAADAACCAADAGGGCADGLACVSGACRQCPARQQACDGRCVSLSSDEHCGACGARCVVGFACVASAADAGGPRCERVCSPAQTRCGGGEAATCVTLTMDPRNCGACGARCDALSNVEAAACARGRCEVGTCASGFANCDLRADNGCEADTLSSAAHCGRCGGACAPPANGIPLCRNGSCDFVCRAGYGDCDGNPGNGCEAVLASDVANCSACGNVCVAPPGRAPVCVDGTCAVNQALCAPGTADCNGQSIDGCEVRTAVGEPDGGRVRHCGACGRACEFANAGAQCLAGTCVIGACAAGFANCDGAPANGCETDLARSTTHCGRCGGYCNFPNASPTCMTGACALASCNQGFADCNATSSDGCEVDTRTNPQHCGRCGRSCPTGEQCVGGSCMLICATGQRSCAGRCVDPSSDNLHCGACGTACASGQLCSAGRCATTCGLGLTNCTGSCRDLSTDRANCGACGRTCAAGEICEGQVCRLSCPAGQTPCGGACRELSNDPANCGACATNCAGRFANSAPSCAAGACALGICTGTFANCDGSATNGCEVNLANTVNHCGACGNDCAFANGGASCVSGRCVLGACLTGFGNCDGIAENGCETNLNTAVGHCGACQRVCTTSVSGLVPVCNTGSCGTALATCPAGRADCDGSSTNGCEADIATSLSNCGACGQACARANAAEACVGGACVLGACVSGFGNCDGDTLNGCEANVRFSVTHCGGCGRPCFYANASAQCFRDTCALGACAAGFANCDSVAGNGCEAALLSDRANCGACGRACAPGLVCAAGVCTLMCQSGQSNCAGSCVNTATDRANCGGCGNACAAGRICQGGACVLSCPSGQTACGSLCVNPETDGANCGVCGNVCTGGRVCSAGACTCPSGQTLCGGVCVDLRSSFAHCGVCNRACAAGQVCSNSACVTTCAGGLSNCSGACVDIFSSVAHCGACGSACALANATQTCSGGTCGIGACLPGFANCNGMTVDGCEVNITNTVTNCNGCNNNCATLPGVNSATCVAGACANLVCFAGRANCNGSNSDGCESNLASDAQNCGACGVACGGGAPRCVGGSCAP